MGPDPRAVLWDMDGTLVDVEAARRAGMRAVAVGSALGRFPGDRHVARLDALPAGVFDALVPAGQGS